MSRSLLHSITTILDRGLNTNSYKFALLRALGDFGREGAPRTTIDYPWITEQFVRYFWPLTLRFRVRQQTSYELDPVIMRLVREEAANLGLTNEYPLERYKREHPQRFAALVEKAFTSGRCLDNVVPRFHTVAGESVEPRIYDYSGRQIRLRPGVQAFLVENHRVLNRLAVGAWVRFTEKFTTAPKLYEKIAGITALRSNLGSYLALLVEIQSSRCFYCGRTLATSAHVDHVIPWSYVLEDRVWNLVVVCPSCNSAKRDRSPDDRLVERLIERNHVLMDDVDRLAEEGVHRRPVRELQEWRSRNLADQVWTLVTSCRGDGFGVWDGPSFA